MRERERKSSRCGLVLVQKEAYASNRYCPMKGYPDSGMPGNFACGNWNPRPFFVKSGILGFGIKLKESRSN